MQPDDATKAEMVSNLWMAKTGKVVSVEAYAVNDLLVSIRHWLRRISSTGVQRRGTSQWQTAEYAKYIRDNLTQSTSVGRLFFTDGVKLDSPDSNWHALGAKVARNGQISEEIDLYETLIHTHHPIALGYLNWAVDVTQSLLMQSHASVQFDYNSSLQARPRTVAEAIGDTPYLLLGTTKLAPIVEIHRPSGSSQYGTMRVINIPVRPDKRLNKLVLPRLTVNEVIYLAKIHVKSVELIDRLNDYFEEYDRRMKHLKTYRELVRSDEPDSQLYPLIDSEMQLYYNIELFAALYSRLHSISDAIARRLYEGIEKK